MTNMNVLNTEEAIVSNLMRNPDLLGKLKLKPQMFNDDKIQGFIQYIMDKLMSTKFIIKVVRIRISYQLND